MRVSDGAWLWERSCEGGVSVKRVIWMILCFLLTACQKEELSGSLQGKTDVSESREVAFTAQYIRANGYHKGVGYPGVKMIRTIDELKDYFEMEQGEEYALGTQQTLLDACEKYDEVYFENRILVLLLVEESSGSVRHKVKYVGLTQEEKPQMVIEIQKLIPEVGTCDMAQWYILIEPEAGVDVATESDITVFFDGVNATDRSMVAQYDKGYANISLKITDGWEYEIKEDGEGPNFGIAIWPAGQTKGKIEVWYDTTFGVCGTGLVQEKIKLGNYEAYQGTYDNNKVWDFISLIGLPGRYVVRNMGADVWWDVYGDEAMQILDTLVVGENIITEAQAIEIAQAKATVEYDAIQATYDDETGIWTVALYKKNIPGGDQVIIISADGNILEVVYGE